MRDWCGPVLADDGDSTDLGDEHAGGPGDDRSATSSLHRTTIEQSQCLERVWYPDLEAVVARSDDIVIARVTAVGPTGSGPGGAPIATLTAERNLLHDDARSPVTVFDMGDQVFVCRSPLEQGSA